MASRWRVVTPLILGLLCASERAAFCDHYALLPTGRRVSVATGTEGGRVWLRPLPDLRGSWCESSPCDLFLYPVMYDVIVDDPGRVRLHQLVAVEPATTRMVFSPRTELGDAVTAFGLSVGPLAMLAGVMVGALRTSGCDDHRDRPSCSSDAFLSAWPIWGAGAVVTGIGVYSLFANRATVEKW